MERERQSHAIYYIFGEDWKDIVTVSIALF